MKKIIYIIFILSTVMMASACSSSAKQEKLQITEEINKIKEDNQTLIDQVNDLTKKNEDLNAEIVILQEALDKLKKGDDTVTGEGESLLRIYSANINTYEKEEVGQLSIKNTLPLEEKLEMVADSLSKDVFQGLGIELSKIDTIHGKQVAVINLTEKDNAQGATWNTMYFQGSAGGSITSVALGDTFLQKGYDGEWIDGVKFLYNNKEINFEHVGGLSEVNYR